ncbi:cobyrinate a,c-diamide synthase [Actinomadura terrae]|uniref:cobyrinate a,c-diamide synthase n=1 Tax=Actinomadura terrae TaxID=604353 RepID=UPI001FA6CFF8|nr:cobyrinate a,c-diamide synthase [Actinomadura terrae]
MTDRLVVAAPASGSGKTTVATGLMAALRARGRRVAPFKVGPDYIDPGYHTLATGVRGRNLDPVMVGEQRIPALFAHGAAGADIAVVEGVMGMFDGGNAHDDFGSTAHVARLLDAPVVLVVDAWGQTRSIGAVLTGFRDFDPEVRVAGVVANRIGSAVHARILADTSAEVGVPFLGALPRTSEIVLPSRHLGLVTAAEHGAAATDAIGLMAALVAEHVDLAAVAGLAATAPPLGVEPWSPAAEVVPVPGEPVIAVAGGKAFTFGYAEHLELLTAAGARVRVFDPLYDERLPTGTSGVVLPGGFPEQHAEELSANASLRRDVLEFAKGGGAVHAECGGLLYLVRSLDGHRMCGVLDAEASMSGRLRLGYREAVATEESVFAGGKGARVGHEFHHTVISPPHGAVPAWSWRAPDGSLEKEGFVQDGVHASYLHLHPAGNPDMVTAFVRRCAASR